MRRRQIGAGAFLAIAVGISLAVAVFVAWPGSGGGGSATAPGVLDDWRPEVGRAAPDFALVDARDGETVRRLSDYRGKIVILNWYASWCGPCYAELPDFEAVYQAFGDDLVVLAVNLQEERGDAAGVLDATGATFPAVLDSDGAVAGHYGLSGMPTTYFIDREGIVRMFGGGRIFPETLAEELAKLGLGQAAVTIHPAALPPGVW